MIFALKEYLIAQGYLNVYIDTMPSIDVQLAAIYIGKWDHTVPSINDGTGLQYIQIQVRRDDPVEAYNVCNAIFKLLDSGLDEIVIQLNATKSCIARPRRGAIKLDGNDKFTTYYCELALWGEN